MYIVKRVNIKEELEIVDEDIIKDFMNCGEHGDCDNDCNNCLAFIDLGGFTFCSLLSCYKRELVNNLLVELEKL